MNINLKSLINKSEIISFDIFDTLLVRPFAQPHDVFSYLEQRYACPGFCGVRKKAEEVASKYYKVQHVIYDEIYEILPEEYKHLKEKEKEFEKNILYQNPEMKEIYDYVLAQGKKIIFTTDMYLDEDALSFALKRNGYNHYDKIYISSYVRKAKHDYTLFPHIINDLKIEPDKILHIGDNPHADYNAPMNAGIVAYQIKSPKEKFFEANPRLGYFYDKNKHSLTAGVIIGMLIKRFIENKALNNYWQEFGYVWGGPVCYGLSKFIDTEMKKENINEIICVARDGYTIEKILKLIHPDLKTHYIYASRIIHILSSLEFENELPWTNKSKSLIQQYRELSDEFAALCPSKDFSNNEERVSFIKKHLNTLKPLAENIYKAYISYIKTFNITDAKRIALFDISAGTFTSLKILRNVLPEKDILALYWFTVGDCPFDTICKTYDFAFTGNNELLEFIVTAPELPVKSVTQHGELVRCKNKHEKIRAKVYEEVSKGELEYAKDIAMLYGSEIFFEAKVLVSLMDVFVDFPTEKDCRNFKNILHGVDETHSKYKPIINKKNVSLTKKYIKLMTYKILSGLFPKNKNFTFKKHKYRNQIKIIKEMKLLTK